MDIFDFIARWAPSSGSERANKDAFLIELCDLLDVPRPDPTTGQPEEDTYVFEKDALMPREGGTIGYGKMDLYRAGAFILEAKQGSDKKSKKRGTAKRGTPGWTTAMNEAYGQVLAYANSLDRPVPFLIVCDIGECFDLYASFDGSYRYGPFPNAQNKRIFLKDLENAEHRETLRRIFLDPYSLDASKRAAKVTTEISKSLATLATALEKTHDSELVAKFLLRCLFTMFAEDIGLLPPRLFTDAVQNFWIPNPASFTGGIESLWRAMNTGGDFGYTGKLLRFNGGLFDNPTALPLTRQQLLSLLTAAEHNWAEVEPAIFGTLIEQALNKKERHALGAHYTPRAYVERLVRPTIEEPLRVDWEIVQIEARHLVNNDKVEAARKLVRQFHQKLCKTKVLDPACGSGNFLYVGLDLFLRLESEVLALLEDLGDKQTLLHADTIRVTPGQFLGIELKFLAKQIAELVLWIGYLQHHFRAYGKMIPPPEPVLQNYRNIECRDAILEYDVKELVCDEAGKPITRWDGETYKKSPVTGEDVPDESARVPVYRYVNPRKAEWPKADFIVGNPPFMGVNRMRVLLGDGYVQALRETWSDVPDGVDYVLYWWNKASTILGGGALRRFGLITTNSIGQATNRRVLQTALGTEQVAGLVFAIPDHPWVDEKTGAAVRIAMTVASREQKEGTLVSFAPDSDEEGAVPIRSEYGRINPNLTVGADVTSASKLKANFGICAAGVNPWGNFVVGREGARALGLDSVVGIGKHLRRYMNGRDLVQKNRDAFIIDAYGLADTELREQFPTLYQHLFMHVKPERDLNKNTDARKNWWLFTGTRRELRAALRGCKRYISTSQTAKHRVFVFLDVDILPGVKLVNIASDDALILGLVSSTAHTVWASATGGRIGKGNDLVYNSTLCFETFPFPTCTAPQSTRIRNLAESLDTHRKRQQSLHPNLTITGIYNVLEKLRSGEALSAKEKLIHEEGLVSVLRQIHDELDAAVFDAYGWPHDLSDEEILEKLVALNAERAAEERQGLVRWLRPEFQNPGGHKEATQVSLVEEEEALPDAPKTAPAWPKKLPEQVALVRDWLSRNAKSGFSVRELSKAFKGGKAKEVELVLDSLAALGIAIGYEKDGERRWRGAGRALG